MSMNKDD
jgi:hypothetical protein